MTPASFADLVQSRPAGRDRWQAKCPAHPDKSPSLSIHEGAKGRVLLRCWAGCETRAVLAALGLTMRDLFSDEPPSRATTQKVQAERLLRDQEHRRRSARQRQLSDVARRMALVIPILTERLMRNPSCDVTAALLTAALSFARAAEAGLPPC